MVVPVRTSSPPRLPEWILRQLIEAEDMDAVLGDFAEEYNLSTEHDGHAKATWSYWSQVIRSCLPLIALRISRQTQRSLAMSENMRLQDKRFLWIGLVALLPAVLLVISGVLQSGFGITAPNDAQDVLFQRYALLKLIIHPLVLLGGLGVAFILNLLPAVGLQWSRDTQSLSATFTLKNHLLHWALVGMSLLLLGSILLYAVVENFKIIPR